MTFSREFPKKLTPDNLKDTLVEIRFLSGIPQELILGSALSVLSPLGFKYVLASTPNSNKDLSISLGDNQQIVLGFGGNGGFFIKGDVRIQLAGNLIVQRDFEDEFVFFQAPTKEGK